MAVQIKEFQIIEFQPDHQRLVEELVLPIQQLEFKVNITRDEQTDLVDIANVFQKGKGNFWVAVKADRVIGSIGLVDIGDGRVALKKMFVHRDHRGKETGVSTALMNAAKEWCRKQSVSEIYLGTVSQMVAAQRFYEKHGFIEVDVANLPPTFPIVHVDSKFYGCKLS